MHANIQSARNAGHTAGNLRDLTSAIEDFHDTTSPPLIWFLHTLLISPPAPSVPLPKLTRGVAPRSSPAGAASAAVNTHYRKARIAGPLPSPPSAANLHGSTAETVGRVEMVISNGSFHCGVAAVQRLTARSRVDDELEFTPLVLVPYLPRLYPPFPSALACENQPSRLPHFLLF